MAENQPTGSGEPQLTEAELEAEVKLPEGIDPDNATPEQVRELLKTSQSALAQKKHWRNKAIDPVSGKPYKELVAAAPKPVTPAAPQPGAQDDEVNSRVKRLETAEEKRQFGHANGLTPEETDNLFAFATGMALKPAEALTHPFFKNGLAASRQERQVGDATPGPSRRAPTVEGKSFDQMTAEERKKNFPAIIKAASGKK